MVTLAAWKMAPKIVAYCRRFEMARETIESVPQMRNDVAFIVQELRPNGGSSLRDKINEINCRLSMDFRMRPYPAFYCHSNGKNVEVSDAYLKLIGVHRMSDLDNLDWVQYLDAAKAPAYMKAFTKATRGHSDFQYKIGFVDCNMRSLGTWLVKAYRLNSGMYLGQLYPQDEISQIALKRAQT